ncbi:unnamed protein product [Adineta steineri]|uniref:Transmembrane protein n=1 Tax=Adineta steineri TaxID=433720 RepID=A0A813TDU4_9BILA|nr:unnamed protein product [Adineta steineri]CAF0888059.1 unnamed protein product [Adineta steineri]CAF3732805.1 unnamed protein product [Adineta steineri]CAF3865575.1 unnamed protein product [Adineta steineri]
MLHNIVVRPIGEHQDGFFLWAMIILPILSLCAYVGDAFYFYHVAHKTTPSLYEGLLSTILILFAYLQYCAPIKSRALRLAYHILLYILIEVGHIGYILTYSYKKNLFSVIIFVGWMLCDTVFTAALIYCRVYRGCDRGRGRRYKRKLDVHIDAENKDIFHFISRLDVILALFIPIFLNADFSTTTRDNIAFFLLFDFFSEKYEHFNRAWIKACLYLFAAVTTVSIACEWLYFGFHTNIFHQITDISELVAACFCYTLIIMQFFPYHFKPRRVQKIAHQVQDAVAVIQLDSRA